MLNGGFGLLYCWFTKVTTPDLGNDLAVLFIWYSQWISPTLTISVSLCQKYGVCVLESSFNLCVQYLLFPITGLVCTSIFFMVFG